MPGSADFVVVVVVVLDFPGMVARWVPDVGEERMEAQKGHRKTRGEARGGRRRRRPRGSALGVPDDTGGGCGLVVPGMAKIFENLTLSKLGNSRSSFQRVVACLASRLRVQSLNLSCVFDIPAFIIDVIIPQIAPTLCWSFYQGVGVQGGKSFEVKGLCLAICDHSSLSLACLH